MPTPLEQTIEAMIVPSLESMGYAVVRVKYMDGGVKTLQIMAERISDRRLELNDCEVISRTISALLDVEDPISDAYNLEVSSPGIDRPLIKREDFIRYIGHMAKISLKTPLQGRKRYAGTILGVSEQEEIQLQLPDEDMPSLLPFASIDAAKLVITDALLKANNSAL